MKMFKLLLHFIIVRIIDIARRLQNELKNNYDCRIETKKSSTETGKIDSFIFSTEKIKQSGFYPEYGDKEIRLLLDYCNNNY